MKVLDGSTSGKTSAMRVCVVSIVFSVLVMFLVHNIISAFTGGGFVSIGQTEVTLVVGVLIGKAAQRFGEGKKPDTLPENIYPKGDVDA